MGTGYTRQSLGVMITSNVITAAMFNAEFNQLESAFNSSTGHSHDGTSGEGPLIDLSTSTTGSLSVARGGTGASTLTDGGILLGSGTSAITAMAVLADGSIVVGDGSTDPVALAAFTSSTGTLKHESGGLEADVSAYNGLVKISGGSTSAVAAPTGTIVGTSDSQTLTNKTIVAANNTITMASTDLSDTADIAYLADTDASALGWVVDEDDLSSDSDTKVPTQQSVKAYIDNQGVSTEAIQDIVGGMVTGNTETGITVTYEDGDGTLDFVLSDEYIQDVVGAMFTGNTETGISVTYQDGDGTIDLVVSGAATELSTDTTPQLGGDLDLNGYDIQFPTTAIMDALDEDNMASNSATALATQQSIKAYVDSQTGLGSVVEDTTPQLGGDLDLNGNAIDFPSTANIADVLDEDNMASNSATSLATQQSIKAYVDNNHPTRDSLSIDTDDTVRFAGLNIGHASDTTVTRASAGNLAIEGNIVYRAGGTDVPITDGGTGASSAATAVTNLFSGTVITEATVATGDKVLIQDVDASDALKVVTAQSIADLADTATWSLHDNSTLNNDDPFTVGSIPAGTNEIVILFQNIDQSTSGSATMTLGDSGGLETSGYIGHSTLYGNGPILAVSGIGSGLLLRFDTDSTGNGIVRLRRLVGNLWEFEAETVNINGADVRSTHGYKTLSGELTQWSMDAPSSGDFNSGTVLTYIR